MPLYKVPVPCPKCHKVTFVISPGDKYYCLNEECLFQSRLSTLIEGQAPDDENVRAINYYVGQLEEQVLRYRGIDPQKFRVGDDDGQPRPVFACESGSTCQTTCQVTNQEGATAS